MNAAQVLEEFADSARPTTGRSRHFDNALELEPIQPRTPRDWSEFVASRLDKSAGPDACWLWRGAPRIALRMRRKKVEGVWKKKILEQVEFRRLIWLVIHGELPNGRIYVTCKEEWCGNHGHFIEKRAGEKKPRVHTSFGKSQPIAARRIEGRSVPILVVPKPDEPPEVTDEDALVACIAALRPLAKEARARVLAAAVAFLP